MPVTYYGLGSHRRLSEIVFAGSHDASITSGKSNAQTQSLDIAGQALAGVRLFDLRILARSRPGNKARLVGFHGSKGGKFSRGLARDPSQSVEVHKRMNLGTFGLSLSNMLHQAKAFVSTTNEFLIFKFDKCTNWELIAEMCVSVLGASIYVPPNGMELGRETLKGLKHKVVCVFNDSNLGEISYGPGQGILGFKNLQSKDGNPKNYTVGYPGMQYFGKGGTNPKAAWKTKQAKIAENIETQSGLMEEMAVNTAPQSPYVLGMMYWTTTGLTHSIKTRNKAMWNTTGVRRMEELWHNGLEASVGTQLKQDRIKHRKYGGKRHMKAFFPNVVMIDFADDDKCQTIFDLNKAADDRLASAYDAYVS